MAWAFKTVESDINDARFFLVANGTDLDPVEDLTIIHGDARGADRMAGKIGPDLLREHFRYVNIEAYPADWEKHGKRAGFIRNQEMVDKGADLCLAFFVHSAANRGTSHCVSRAEAAGIPVRKFYS